ncbi:MAG: hypothetical protein ABIZ70_14310 [Gemmatimonadales bacterium]
MNYPIRNALILALLLAPLAYGAGITGAPALLLQLVDVFFAVSFVLLLLLHLFFNRKWRIDPGPQWRTQSDRRGNGGLAHSRPW